MQMMVNWLFKPAKATQIHFIPFQNLVGENFFSASNNINSVHSNHPLQPFIVTGASKSCPTTEMASKKRDNVKPKSATPIGTYLNSRDRIKRKKKMGWAQGLLKKKVVRVYIYIWDQFFLLFILCVGINNLGKCVVYLPKYFDRFRM